MTGAQDATLQERLLRAEIPLSPRRRVQHFQRPTPSHVSTITPRAPRCGDDHVARGRRGRMKIRTSYSPLALFTCQRDDASPFLVFKSKFAVRSQRIPCYVAQGIYRQLSNIAYYSFIGVISEGPKATKFPVLFLLAGNLDLADGFGGLRPPPVIVNRAKP